MKNITKKLIGKKIQKATLMHDRDTPTVVLEFTDGTTFSILAEAKPKVEAVLFLSKKDGDELKVKLS